MSIIQAHYLTSYPASLLNRDDAGFAKRIDFGGRIRIRVSSQCLKRAWREVLMDMADESLPTAIRSCSIFEQRVLPEVVAAGIPEERARLGLRALIGATIKGSLSSESTSLVTKQPILLGHREVQMVVRNMIEHLSHDGAPETLVAAMLKKDVPVKTFAQVFGIDDSLASGVEAAMFGRFVTSDVLSRTDSSVSVAHGMTVHLAAPELDFFAVVDDLNRENGADHIGESELSAGLFYQYASIDLAALTVNMTGCAPADWKAQDLTVPKKLAALLLRLIAIKSPGAKKGATAPYARSEFVLIESGLEQPRQLVNAFLKPVRSRSSDDDLMSASVAALAKHLRGMDNMYGVDTQRVLASVEPVTLPNTDTAASLNAAIAQAVEAAAGQAQ